MAESLHLVDFGVGPGPAWRPVHDGVMGGLSVGALVANPEGFGRFAGGISLANGGGFASVRAAVGPCDVSAWDGLAVRARGDGRIWQLRLRPAHEGDGVGVAWRAFFRTEPGQWDEIRLPFAQFTAVFRGRLVPGAGPFDPRRLGEIGFMTTGAPPGPFALDVAWVRAWR